MSDTAAVRRLTAGEELVIADGLGEPAVCVVETVQGKESLTLRIDRRWSEPLPQPRIILAQALIKGDRGELATETGVDVVVPWRAGRSTAERPRNSPGGPGSRTALNRSTPAN